MQARKRPSRTDRENVKRREIMAPPDDVGPRISSPVPMQPMRTSPIGGGDQPTVMYSSLSASLNGETSPPIASPPFAAPSLATTASQTATALTPAVNVDLDNGVQTLHSGRASPPGHLHIPKIPSMAQVAMSAMQYLPTPLLILSSLKMTVFANDAMGKLLGLDQMPGSMEYEDQGSNITDKLLGQNLSQIGIDLLQDGHPAWVNWERFLDGLSQRSAASATGAHGGELISSEEDLKILAREASQEPGDSTPHSSSGKRKRPVLEHGNSDEDESSGKRFRDKSYVHDIVVDVVLSSQFVGQETGSLDPKNSFLPYRHLQAKMVISIWSMDGQQFYSLAFSAASPTASSSSSRTQIRMASRTPTTSSPSSLGVGGPAHCTHCGSVPDMATPPARTSPSEQPLAIAPFAPVHTASAPSVLQRTLKLKDAIINGMQEPKFAMWKDESIVVPNKAGEQILKRHTDPTSSETLDPLSRLVAYTEDFSRQLEPEESPIVALCRTQKPFRSWKVGYLDKDGNRVVYDVSGECLYDETGEFIGGITALKDVTEYAVKLREQSDLNEQQFELICDCMPQIAWTTTPTGGHDWFSKRWYEYTGLSEEQSLGEQWANTFHPDDMPETSRRWRHSLVTGDEYVTEYRARSRTGEWRWMLGRALPLRDNKTGEIVKWFGTCTDIHELVEARQEQKRTHEQLQNVINHAKVTVWSINRRKTLTFLEGQLKGSPELSQGNHKSIIGRPIGDVFGQHAGAYDLRKYISYIDKVLSGQLREYVSEHHIDGTERWYRTRFVPILGKKRQAGHLDYSYVDGVVGVSQDVSDLKLREQELQSTEKENVRLLGAETAAKEASRLKSQFLANMSHEIRTPIAGVIGMAELLVDTHLDEDQKELAENIQRSANGLLTVINDILDLSKVESGRLDIEEVQFSLSVVLNDVGKMLSFAAERKSLLFEQDIQINSEQDLIVLGDPGRCRQILTNLLTNSIKFTSEGSVKMAAWIDKETSEQVSVTFAVEDTGIGIEEEVQKKLFKPFSQADSSTARRFGGTGLGLTICKNLVELMRGTISLDSTLGQGTKAVFTIPFAKPQFRDRQQPLVDIGYMPDRFSGELSASTRGTYERQTPPQTPAGGLKTQFLAKKALSASSGVSDLSNALPVAERKDIHVLVVEDNSINQQIALRTIRKLGFSVSAVWNGKEALEYLLKSLHPALVSSNTNDSKVNGQPSKPDVILMDVQMPILDGYRATHQIRHHNPYKSLPGIENVPIVAMTASAIQGDREKCQRAGMDDYLAKPVKGAMLEKMLVKWAMRSKQQQQQQQRSAGSSASGSLIGAKLDDLDSIAARHVSSSDHDSNCTETDIVLASIPPFHQPKPSAPDQHTGSRSSRLAHDSSFPEVMSPPAESEGDRGLRRQAAEEKASALRDDKLVHAAESDEERQRQDHSNQESSLMPSSDRENQQRSLKRLHSGAPSEHVRSHSKVEALTEENLGTMNREREASTSLEQQQEQDSNLQASDGQDDVDDDMDFHGQTDSAQIKEENNVSSLGDQRPPPPPHGVSDDSNESTNSLKTLRGTITESSRNGSHSYQATPSSSSVSSAARKTGDRLRAVRLDSEASEKTVTP